MKEEKTLYKFNDEILFRVCSLGNELRGDFGDCTNWHHHSEYYDDAYSCNQFGIHYHCAKHPEIELSIDPDGIADDFICPKCGTIHARSFNRLRNECLKQLNRDFFKQAKIIRLDDFYVPEVSYKTEVSDYWVKADVKTDRDGDTIIVLYVGKKGKDKIQYFIKPEKHQLTFDHNDVDPKTIISKIEVTLKDRLLTHEYE